MAFICLAAFITGAFGRLMAGDGIKNRGEKELLLVRDPYLPAALQGSVKWPRLQINSRVLALS